MVQRRMKKAGALFLAIILAFTGVGTVPVSGAEEEEVIYVMPFEGQWKYYGQTKTFREDEHYSLFSETETEWTLDADLDWYLDIESEEVGEQPFVPKGTTAVTGQSVQLAPNAPTFEVRAYTVPADAVAVVEPEGILTVTGPAAVVAPEGYLISNESTPGAVWSEKMEIGALQEGLNVITYYLRSNQKDSTRKAIDQTPKTVTIEVDTIAPVITSLVGGENSTDITAEGSIVGSEPGIYYYMVVPANYPQTVTKELIKGNVASNYGIVGYGRVDGVNAAPLNIKGLMAQTEYRICAYMVDRAGNESDLKESEAFSTDKMALSGEVEVSGTAEVDNTLTAKPKLDSVDPGTLTYQWYRIKVAGDEEELNEIFDETGGAAEDDLEASDDDEDEDDDEDDLVTLSQIKKLAEDGDDSDDEISTIDGAELISGADSAEYKVTKADIGYRLIACVQAENYSGYVAGSTKSFVPKLMPSYTMPTIASAIYSPLRKLSSITLPKRWSWVDTSIVPVYGNSGYRAKYEPEDSAVYKTVVVRVKVPVSKKSLAKSMVKVPKKKAYTGKPIKNNFTVKDQKTELELGKDFRVSYKNNKKLGKATITFTGAGNYKGTVRATYSIQKKSVKSLTCKFKKTRAYTGKKRTAGLVLKNGSVKLKKNKDYTEVYKKNVEIGKATIVICGKGNYKGKRTLHFSIVPRKAAIRKVARKKGGFQVGLSAKKESTGYYVQVSSVRSFKKAKTQEYTTQGKRFGVRNLGKGTTWYVRACAYTAKKGKIYTSAYSKVKKVKTK